VFVPLEFFPYPPPSPLISILFHPLLFCIYKGFHGVPCLFLFSPATLPYFFCFFALTHSCCFGIIICYGTRRKKEKTRTGIRGYSFLLLAPTGFYIIKAIIFYGCAKFGLT